MTAPDDPPGSLRTGAVRGVAASGLQKWGSRLISSVVFVLVARRLDPDDFGLVALAAVFIAFLDVLVESGFGAALIQRKELERQHIDTAFWFSTGMGFAIAGLIQLIAGPIATLLGEPELEPVLRWLAINPVMAGLGSTPEALLRRNLRFGAFASRTLAGNLLGGIAGVGLAYSGFGVWALVGQSVTQSTSTVIILWVLLRQFWPKLSFSRRHFRDLFGFGVHVAGTNLLNLLNRRFDDFLIGAVLGATALGFYTVAYRLLLIATDTFISVIGTVAMPTFARMNGDPERLRNALYAATRMSSALAWPAFLGMGALGPELVIGLFGEQWAPSVPVMRVLSLIGIVHSVAFFNPNLLTATGRPRSALIITAMNAVANVIGFLVAVRFGIVAVASAYVIRGYLLSPIPVLMVRSAIGIRIRTYLGQYVPPLLASAVMVAAVLATTAALQPHAGPVPRLIAGATVGAVVYVIALTAIKRSLLTEALSYVRGALRPGSRRRVRARAS